MQQISNRDKEGAGGKSDASFYKRLHLQSLAVADSALADGGANGGPTLLSLRERLLQSTVGYAAAPRQSSAMIIAIQQTPEWLRTFPLIIHASRLRPVNKMVSGDSKRKRNGDGASSDEEMEVAS
jgi:hypothetical protein